ncbi:MAG: IS4 family transposase [Defluviitaleaceae bacterium]|nr:IS4 family transposase [Defluviitaleaceae bacterium]
MDRLISAIGFVKNMITCANFQTRHKTDRRAFSKEGVLSFERVMLFVLGRVNTLLDFEILNFCEKQNIDTFAKSAMVEARKKIDSGAFRQILQNLSHVLPKDKLFKGHQLVAVDGTELQLPKSPEITKIYGTKKDNCNWPRAHTVAFYDVLNQHYLDATFDSYPCDERQAAISMLNESFTMQPQIYLLDRGFPSIGMIQKLNQMDKKFVFRVAKNFSVEVVAFRESGKDDVVTAITYTKSRTRTNRTSKDLVLPYTFSIRFVKFVLESGEEEILMTNCFDNEFTKADLYTLYGSRWGIETSYNHDKNRSLIEQWGSTLENSIKQEFYSSLILHNLTSLLKDTAQAKYDKKNEVRNLLNIGMA